MPLPPPVMNATLPEYVMDFSLFSESLYSQSL